MTSLYHSATIKTMVRVAKEMSVDKKNLILKLKNDGLTNCKIGELIGVHHSTVSKFLIRFRDRGSVENKARSGRKKIVTARGDRVILRAVKINRREQLTNLTNIVNEKLPQKISARTVRRRLKFYGFNRRKVRKTITISPANRRGRVNWCRGKLAWTVGRHWKKVIFSDETQVVVGQDGQVYVWRKADEVWRPECLGVRGGRRISVMFWGCITYSGVGTLTEIVGSMDTTKYIETLENHLWPVVAKVFPNGGYIYQDDNAPCHNSKRALEWKRQNHINSLNWPSQSPDINIIENVWRAMKIQLRNSKCDIRNKDTLVEEVKRIWSTLTPVYIRSLYNTLPRRVRHVIIQKGHITKY